MKTSILFLTVLLAVLVMFTGCNIYKFTGPSDSQKSLIEEGKQMLRDGDYEGAFKKFDEALNNDPNNSEIRYLHAKAAMRRTGTNAITIATELSQLETNSADTSDLPFMNFTTWPNTRANPLYQGVIIANEDLQMINDGTATGIIKPKDIQLDLVIVLTVNGILLFRDTNGDKAIDDTDINLEVFFQNGRLNLQGIFKIFEQLDAEAVNNLLTNISDILKVSGDVMGDFIRNMAEDEESGLDEDALDQVIENIQNGADMYLIEIDVDNDGDGLIDEEHLNGIDDDGDGLIDEDSNGRRGP
ncbi:MAG: hypothetical protein P9X24_19305 [Candidatus Hatepunaea meridiana]|nr:hypothetical protein [Candidatus Hatepunaea meridiana]